MLISESYREQNARLHTERDDYGNGGFKWRERVRQLSSWGRLSILDYAAGQGTLANSLGPAYTVQCYDPAVPKFSAPPEPASVVVCTDALEHIEPDCLPYVLADLWRCLLGKGLFVVHLVPAKKTLPDGTNTHKIIKPHDWWAETLQVAGFRILESAINDPKNPKEALFVVERAVQ